MNERVSVYRGKSPVLLIAPHAAPKDDYNTGIITEEMCRLLNCNAVINRGWQRSKDYDYDKEQADCNNVTHMIDVVEDEFLRPIIGLKNEIIRQYHDCHIFFIHGMIARNNVDIVLGHGAGTPNSFSCLGWRRNLMYYILEDLSLNVWGEKANGLYSGWKNQNMNQYFRKHKLQSNVQSMQIEISKELRTDKGMSELTAEFIATAVKNYLKYDSFIKNVNVREI